MPKHPKYPIALDAISAIRIPAVHMAASHELSKSIELLTERLRVDLLPFHSISEQLVKQLQWQESAVVKAMEAFKPFNDIGSRISEALGPLQSLRISLGPNISLAEQLQPSLRAIQQLDSGLLQAVRVSFPTTFSTRLAGLASIASTVQFGFGPTQLAYVSEILAEELAATLNEAAQFTDEHARIDATALAATAASRIHARDASFPISTDALLQILFAILIAWVATDSDEQHWAQLSGRLDEILEMQREYHQLQIQAQPRFVVLRRLKFRAEPNTRAAVLNVLSENQQVEMLHRRGQWLYVTYYDYAAEMPRTGWVCKRYLREIISE